MTEETICEAIRNASADIKNDRMRTIFLLATAQFAAVFAEGQDDIHEACEAALDNEDEDGKTPPVRIAHAIILELSKNKQACQISVSIKHKHECENTIPDPNQPELI